MVPSLMCSFLEVVATHIIGIVESSALMKFIGTTMLHTTDGEISQLFPDTSTRGKKGTLLRAILMTISNKQFGNFSHLSGENS